MTTRVRIALFIGAFCACAAVPAHPQDTRVESSEWQRAQPGIEWREAAPGSPQRFRLIAVRVDPRQFEFRLSELATQKGGGAWSIARTPSSAALAFNAGQFKGVLPWGWIVRRGREVLRPGHGPLSTAVVVDTSGRVHLVDAPNIAAVRASGIVREAFQSYPALLIGEGVIPPQLQQGGRGVDLEHRDSRLAIGILRDGRVLIVLTRFREFDGPLGAVPIGPTVPEMADIMRSLGCVRAVMLDGGISGQLLLRTADGRALEWRGLRRVPVGLLVFPR